MSDVTYSTNISCVSYIKSIFPQLRESEKRVAEYIFSEPEQVISSPLIELSAKIGVSDASIIRFCKKIGYSGFSQFKITLARDMGKTDTAKTISDIDENLHSGDEPRDIPYKVIHKTVQALNDTLEIFNVDEYIRAVQAIAQARNINIFGVANSASVGDDFLNKFIRIGVRTSLYSDYHQQIVAAACMEEGDLAIGISHSGVTEEPVYSLKAAREHGATTLCITNNSNSIITQYSDIVLCTASYETEYSSESMLSRITQLAIIDMLFLGVVAQDYEKYTGILADVNSLLRVRALEK